MKENQTNERITAVLHDSRPVSLAEIQSRIFTIRGVQVMLDRDLAVLYDVATKALNQAVKRNIRRFPNRFMFQLTKEEFENWKSQIVTSNIYSQEEIDALKMSARRCPHAFTEQGVAQLSAVLHSDVAEDASVKIMDAFVAMRRFLTANAGLFQRVGVLERKQVETDKKLDVVLDKIEELSPVVTTEELFGTGCVWDAYSLCFADSGCHHPFWSRLFDHPAHEKSPGGTSNGAFLGNSGYWFLSNRVE